jgi:leucyl/phenylalanyl-tRNA---protein transferase
MPVFRLGKSLAFPPVDLAEPEGILAVGGDLTPRRLQRAYEHGIFPWYSEGEPIQWWAPDPRGLIFPAAVRVSASMARILRQARFQVTFDRDFTAVIAACQKIDRRGQPGTWITPDMQAAYCRMHDLGLGHSVECWRDGQLAGGLYGLSFGRAFFGESMFSRQPNASKAALITLCREVERWGFHFVDCQLPTAHLATLGAVAISRDRYLALLQRALQHPTRQGRWEIGAAV